MGYDRILVPLDGSQQAEFVLPHVETMVHAFQSDLLLLHVMPKEGVNDGSATRSQKDARTNITRYLKHVAESLSKKKIQAEWYISYGDPVEDITHFATEKEADLVVMTTHGERSNGPEKMGSVAMAVVSTGEVPVMLLKPPVKVMAR